MLLAELFLQEMAFKKYILWATAAKKKGLKIVPKSENDFVAQDPQGKVVGSFKIDLNASKVGGDLNEAVGVGSLGEATS